MKSQESVKKCSVTQIATGTVIRSSSPEALPASSTDPLSPPPYLTYQINALPRLDHRER
jgi:hypothetical protein